MPKKAIEDKLDPGCVVWLIGFVIFAIAYPNFFLQAILLLIVGVFILFMIGGGPIELVILAYKAIAKLFKKEKDPWDD